MARHTLVSESNRRWVQEGLARSAEHSGDAPLAVQSLALETHAPVRRLAGSWFATGFVLGGFLATSAAGVDDRAAAVALGVGAAVFLLVGAAGTWLVTSTNQRVSDALLWWAVQADALAPRASWARLRRHDGVVLPVLGALAVLLSVVGWLFVVGAVANQRELLLLLVPATVAVNVAAGTYLRGALRRARIEPRPLPGPRTP